MAAAGLALVGSPPAAQGGAGAAVRTENGAPSDVVFREVALEVGIDFVHTNGMIGRLYFPEAMGGGAGVLDYDNDGDLDVYFGQGALLGPDKPEQLIFAPKHPLPLTDRLYRNELAAGSPESLRFVDVTERAGLATTLGYNMGVTTGDYDNDGFVDVYVNNLGSNHLLHNNGDGTFSERAAETGADDPTWSVSSSFFDYDRDGWLDLFIGNYADFRHNLHKDCTNATGLVAYCGPQSYPALPNRLLRSRGDATFENVTAKALAGNPEGTTLGTVIGDYDNNGWIDVYVANDLMPNHLWLNQGDGTFLEDAELTGSAVDGKGQPQASMGVVAGDLNGDGHEDLFMSHLRMEMNTLYINDGTGLFEDRSSDSGLGRPSFSYTGFGTALIDYDNDGVLDLYIANGAVKRIESQLRAGDRHPLHEHNLLFRGLGRGRYEEVPRALQVDVAHSEVSRGVVAGDLDNDGDTDLIVINNAGQARVLLNQVGSRNAWLGLRLLLGDRDRDAVGARVELLRDSQPTQYRRVRTDGSYASANDPRLLFGLGPGEQSVAGLVVTWPDGSRERFSAEKLPLGRYTTLRQGQGESLD